MEATISSKEQPDTLKLVLLLAYTKTLHSTLELAMQPMHDDIL